MIPIDDTKFFLGTLCRNKHNYSDTEYSLRYISNKDCYLCVKDANKRIRAKKGYEIDQNNTFIKTKTIEEAFWLRVDKKSDEECWQWLGQVRKDCKPNKAYGRLEFKNKTYTAHRVSWLVNNGEIPDGLIVCHSCDVPQCVNPSHLFLGTNQDNMSDMVNKQRQAKGENGGNAKLSEDDVKCIISLGLNQNRTQTAKQFNVGSTCISSILNDVNWKHIDKNFQNVQLEVRSGVPKFVTYKNKTKSLKNWAEELNINYKTLCSRLINMNWSIEKAFETPPRKYGQNLNFRHS